MGHLSVINILLNPRYLLLAPYLSPHRIPPIDQKSLDGTLKVYDITRVPALSLDRGIMAASIDICVTSNYTEHSAVLNSSYLSYITLRSVLIIISFLLYS